MNLIKEICAYYKLDMPGKLSFTAQSLYMSLLYIANEVYSRDITPSNGLLLARTGIKDVKTLEKARHELIDLKLISYFSNAKYRLAGKYYIIGLQGQLVENFQNNSGKNPEDTQENFRGISGKKPPHIQEKNIKENNITIPYKEIITYLNTKTSSNYKHTTAKNQDLIRARWNDGFTLHDFQKVIDKKTNQWMGTDSEQYLRPVTLFGTKFESYLNQKGGSNPNAPNNDNYDDEIMF